MQLGHHRGKIKIACWDRSHGWDPLLAGTPPAGTPLCWDPPWLGPPSWDPPAGTGTPQLGLEPLPPGWDWDPPIAEKLRLWRTNKCLLKLQYTYHFPITFLASFSLIVTVTNFINLCTLTSEIYCKMSGIYHYLLIYFHLALGINC